MRCIPWLSLLLLSGAGTLGLVAARSPAEPTSTIVAEDPQAGTYEIDAVHSTVLFRIEHMGVGFSYGRFNGIKGEVVIDADAAKSSVIVEIDAKTIDTANQKRDDHLRGPDFFNVAEFPTITFESKSVKKSGSKYTVSGNLELHGVSKEVTIDMQLVGAKDVGAQAGGYKAGFEGKLAIERKAFGITAFDTALGNEVELTISVETAKK